MGDTGVGADALKTWMADTEAVLRMNSRSQGILGGHVLRTAKASAIVGARDYFSLVPQSAAWGMFPKSAAQRSFNTESAISPLPLSKPASL